MHSSNERVNAANALQQIIHEIFMNDKRERKGRAPVNMVRRVFRDLYLRRMHSGGPGNGGGTRTHIKQHAATQTPNTIIKCVIIIKMFM